VSYNDLRHFADSYGLGVMVAVYLVLVIWAIRPGARQHHDRAANLIFADDGEPAAKNEDISHG
jgi:cytochrome c oxidase cbb3-type subunit 4